MHENKIIALFETWANEKHVKITALAPSGSNRKYFRLESKNKTAIGVYNSDYKENIAFLSFSETFLSKGLKVPKIYSQELKNNIYLIEDLGDTTLFDILVSEKAKEPFSPKIKKYYYEVLKQLPKFQTQISENIDYNLCYPRHCFDKQSIMWDLNYFKYYFLKLAQISFDEQDLENDFEKFSNYLLQSDQNYFLYRDFQSRNIMIKDEEIYFIDYQGGRKGALQYDIASLLFDGKAEIPNSEREELLNFYIEELKKYIHFNEKIFRLYFNAFVLVRIMQAMGTYGFRGFYEQKTHFLQSIPPALKNLDLILNQLDIPIELPTLIPLLKNLVKSEKLQSIAIKTNKLTVEVNSFSFKRGIPIDESGNGGGFVFDCRAITNPGQVEEYKLLTGKDAPVINFLDNLDEAQIFKKNVISITEQSVKRYLERGFKHLTINFGCTGGQHRSVYFAENIAKHFQNNFNVEVELRHREQEMKS